MDEIHYHEIPLLNRPFLIAGFEGWPNAAEVSSFSLQHLVEILKAKRFASIPMENFYEMSSNRPIAIIQGGRLIELQFPENNFYYGKDPSGKDLVLFSGIEPHLRWNVFADLFLNFAQKIGVDQIFTLGGTYDSIPHTYPTVVSGVFNQEDLKQAILEAGLNLTEYAGPISIHTFLLEAARKRGMKALSLWGHAPQYLQTRNIKVACGVLKMLNRMMGTAIDFSRLENANAYFEQQVNDLVNQDPKLQEMVRRLEAVYQASNRPIRFGKSEEAKEDKVIYIQAFLKRQEDGEKKEN